MEIETTPIFLKNLESKKRYVINQGGTRSSKTYSILQALYFKAKADKTPRLYSVVSETMPHLSRGAMRDFKNFLIKYSLYNPADENKTSHIYTVGLSQIEFFSADSMDKVHGPGRNVLFCNEIQNIDYETFFHLSQRTTDQIFCDFNPTHDFWIFENYLNNHDYKEDIEFIHSTIADNAFCPPEIRKDVLRRAKRDDNYRKVYLEGIPGVLEGLIFNFSQAEIPLEAKLLCYGLDFGYSVDPSAVVAIYKHNDNLYLDEKIYQTELNNAELGRLMMESGIKKGYDEIFADSSEPKSINELKLQGFNIKPVKKGTDSIRVGIDIMKQYSLNITKQSLNGIKELRSYHWIKDKDGKDTQKPTEVMNHFIDASRYGCMMKLGKMVFSDYYAT